MPKIKIYLIEDEPDHATETIEKLDAAAKDYGGEYDFEFEWLKGTVEKYLSKRYVFYEEKVLKQITEHVKKEKKMMF